MHYDIFGDIHGHADQMEILLQRCGYKRIRGIYQHPEGRKAIFVGDLIDRGTRIRETLHQVRDMQQAGHAEVVMGNHEFNAISFHTPHTEQGGFFRDHTLAEIEQHIETLRQFKHYMQEWDEFLAWFKELPLYLDKGHFRVVHACWDPAHIQWLQNNYRGMDKAFLKAANDKQDTSGVHRVVEETLKGKEYSLPEGYSFLDKEGVPRRECRIKWWLPASPNLTLGEYLFNCPEGLENEPAGTGHDAFHYADKVPVFFGHYWLKDKKPVQQSPYAICLDYSVAKNGMLVVCSVDVVEGNMNSKFSWQQYAGYLRPRHTAARCLVLAQ